MLPNNSTGVALPPPLLSLFTQGFHVNIGETWNTPIVKPDEETDAGNCRIGVKLEKNGKKIDVEVYDQWVFAAIYEDDRKLFNKVLSARPAYDFNVDE